ncbi:phage tail tube protein [Chromobacterium subtsugae]|uniref:phage tail tube protein n=1 Tax=Chromobacterium subtsugae TaxID=251747 RepID=UPI00128E893A|nr:phage tail tube protein [Chromobacterium subtsugae]
MMALNSKRVAIIAKVEAKEGVDAVPTGAANAILVASPKVTPLDSDRAERNVVRPYFGNAESVVTGVRMKAEFEVELAGAGAPGAVPAWGVLLRGCGFAETVAKDASASYAPISGGHESLTLYYNLDGVQHKLLGARGTVSLDLQNKAFPKMKFVFTGVHGGIVDAPAPALKLTPFQTPMPFDAANVASFSLYGYSPAVQSLSLDMANEVKHRSLPGGVESVLITGRKPSGSAQIESTRVAEKDWFALARTAERGALALVHGKTAGNIIQIDATVSIGSADYGDSDNISMTTLPLALLPTNGDDEIKITVR